MHGAAFSQRAAPPSVNAGPQAGSLCAHRPPEGPRVQAQAEMLCCACNWVLDFQYLHACQHSCCSLLAANPSALELHRGTTWGGFGLQWICVRHYVLVRGVRPELPTYKMWALNLMQNLCASFPAGASFAVPHVGPSHPTAIQFHSPDSLMVSGSDGRTSWWSRQDRQ